MIKQDGTISVAIVGHVDHGKSTLLGRLLAETQNLPDGKLERIMEECNRNSKSFEYAFLIDALKDERNQGITIDSARCFFKSKKRNYIFIDAPGHVDFLKNMVSGASRADSAILVIDASEGIKENTRRHGYFLSMLGIKQIAVCVNKMDLVEYDKGTFEGIKADFTVFLSKINLKVKDFVPVSSIGGENISTKSEKMNWYKGRTILETIDSFSNSQTKENRPFRMPVQDIYKFSDGGDKRRLIAGRIETGNISVGDKVIFHPSEKKSRIRSIETFNAIPKTNVEAGHSTSFTLEKEVYVPAGEIMCKENEGNPPITGRLLKAMIFWMGENSLVPGKEYKLKLATTKNIARVRSINRTLNASSLENMNKNHLDQYEVGECIVELVNPLAFDTISDFQATGRFVLVDQFEISGGGIIVEPVKDGEKDLKKRIDLREIKWERSELSPGERLNKYNIEPSVILITGKKGIDKVSVAKKLEHIYSDKGYPVYYIGIRNIIYGIDSDIQSVERYRNEHIRRLAEVIHILLDAGLIAIATASDLNENDIDTIKTVLRDQLVTTVIIGDNYLVENKAQINIPQKGAPKILAEEIFKQVKVKQGQNHGRKNKK